MEHMALLRIFDSSPIVAYNLFINPYKSSTSNFVVSTFSYLLLPRHVSTLPFPFLLVTLFLSINSTTASHFRHSCCTPHPSTAYLLPSLSVLGHSYVKSP